MFLKKQQEGSSLGIQAFLLPLIIIALGIGANMFYLYTIRGNLQRLANDAAHVGLSWGRDFTQPVGTGVDFLYDAEIIGPQVADYLTEVSPNICSNDRCAINMSSYQIWVNRAFTLVPQTETLAIHHVSNAPFCGSRENPCTADRQVAGEDTYEWSNKTPAVAVYFEAVIPSPIPIIGDHGVITAHIFAESALYQVDVDNFQEALPWEN